MNTRARSARADVTRYGEYDKIRKLILPFKPYFQRANLQNTLKVYKYFKSFCDKDC